MADLMNVSLDLVEIIFVEVPARRLEATGAKRRLQTTLQVIFRVIVPDVTAAQELEAKVSTISTEAVATELVAELSEVGFTEAAEVIQVTKAPVVTIVTTSTTEAATTITTTGAGTTTTTAATDEDAPDNAIAGKLSAVALIATMAMWN
mmetsp:Transcript_14439/g.34270  ORF Transcript_14439/g.34270 Transcript_14439/m.34270 type:complete len:149 (-) Transcript_14439:129-575(-)